MTTRSWNLSAGDRILYGYWNGDDDPFKRRVNPYEKVYFYQTNSSAPIFYVPGGYFDNTKPTSVQDLWSGSDSDAQQQRLLHKLAARVQETDFNLAVSLGEARESFGTIASSARRIAKALIDVRHGRFPQSLFPVSGVVDHPRQLTKRRNRNKPYRPKDVSAAWLEYAYGWAPLVQDAFNAAEFAAAILRPKLVFFNISDVGYAKLGVSGGLNWGGWDAHGFSAHRKRLHVTLDEAPSLADNLGLTDPASVVWELLPYSFVVDWFIPVGTWLRDRAILSNVKGRYFTTEKVTVQLHGATATDPRYSGTHPIRRRTFMFKRTGESSLESLGTPSLYFRDFSQLFRADPGVRHVVDAIALLSASRYL